ncbi:MAG: hypothetical protein AB7V27_12505 [Candidatus Binatia bacterium]
MNSTHVTPLAAAAAMLMVFSVASANAQCVGDCDGNNAVAVNEIIVGVNIALDIAPVSSCPSFDTNASGTVEVSELVRAVGFALTGCPVGNTPTVTPTGPTPTATEPGPTATPTMPVAGCGDGRVDLEAGETCDDGNALDGDACPADCRVELCQASGDKVNADVVFTTDDPELLLVGLSVFVKYSDGVVDVPGLAGDPAVIASVTSDVFAVTPTDFNYGTAIVLLDPFQGGWGTGTVAASIAFDRCQGAPAPAPADFTCTVTDAVDTNVNTVTDRVLCSVQLR